MKKIKIVRIRKTQFFVFICIFLVLTSFSSIKYILDYLQAQEQKRWDKIIFSAPEQVSIQFRTYILYALTYFNGMPIVPKDWGLVVSWELSVDGFIFPTQLDKISFTNVWFINNKERYIVDILIENNTTYLYRYIGMIDTNILNPFDLRISENASVVVMFRYHIDNYFLKGKIIRSIFVCW